MQIVEVLFPPGARVAFDTGARVARVHQQICHRYTEYELRVAGVE